jgi:hypothetical protein
MPCVFSGKQIRSLCHAIFLIFPVISSVFFFSNFLPLLQWPLVLSFLSTGLTANQVKFVSLASGLCLFYIDRDPANLFFCVFFNLSFMRLLPQDLLLKGNQLLNRF